MFTQVDIDRFGSFEGFEWKKAVRDKGNNVGAFKRLNVIYGRNYSGKTTLSRVFRSMQEGALPWNHDGAKFEARGAGFTAQPAALKAHRLDIRVYNRDFVAENLSVLIDHRAGQIKTFAIVGGDNNKIVEELAKIQATLGNAEEKTGARHASRVATEAATKARAKTTAARESFDELLRRHAADKIKRIASLASPSTTSTTSRRTLHTW